MDALTECIMCGYPKHFEELMFLECLHSSCRSCVRDLALRKTKEWKISEVKCVECGFLLSSFDLREVLDERALEEFNQASLLEVLNSQGSNFIQCPNFPCVNIMEIVRSDTPHEGIGNKFACNVCEATFCASCKASPYHSGYTCDQAQSLLRLQQCRFCNSKIMRIKLDSCTNVCDSSDCQQKRSMACNKILRCGHYCGGIKGEANCLTCLHPQCRSSQASSHCGICLVDRLQAAPCVQLHCKHIFHLECVKRQIRNQWTGARISFRFMECALCKEQIHHPVLKESLRPVLELYDRVKGKAVQRLRIPGIVSIAGTEKEVADYAMSKYAYFMCHQCKQPYYGGENACEDARTVFDPKELLCGWCSTKGSHRRCDIHGCEFLEYKCRYCCAPSMFFCWGTSHFCETCHTRAGELALTPPERLPSCNCTVDHPPNGEEFCFGCLACKSEL